MLKVERLTKTYNTAGGPLTVLRDVTFELPAGSSIAVVGPSGSGKTTLLGLCAGLDRPSDGAVILAGEPIGALSEDARALVRNRHVGFMFQNFQLVPTLTALENVTVPIELRGEGGREVMEAGRELLADELRTQGADVTEVVAYRTVAVEADRDGEPDIYRMLLERSIDEHRPEKHSDDDE